MLEIVYMALCAGAVTMTLSRAKIFKNQRMWLLEHLPWLGELIICPYCTSHWVSFGLVAYYRVRLVKSSFALVDYLTSTFALVTLTCAAIWVITKGLSRVAAHPRPGEEKDESD